MDSIAEKDKARMQRINEQLGIAGAQDVEEIADRKASQVTHSEEKPKNLT